jgi:uncharacterized protein YprB with RNaseH-like and TPR domain
MLRRSFVLLPGVGEATERELWEQGVASWRTFHEADPERLPGRVRRRYDEHVDQLDRAEDHLADRHTRPFERWLPDGDTWRMLDDVLEDTLFLDIETTGLSYPAGRTTVVGGHVPREGTTALVRGHELDHRAVEDLFEDVAALVTFNGKRFDVPFLEREFGVTVDVPHVDLMYAFRKVGISGGLKSIEKQLGVRREDEVDGMDGYEAVKLWRAWERGDREALDTLLAYNREDVENMVPLARTAYEKLVRERFEDVDVDAGDAQVRLEA